MRFPLTLVPWLALAACTVEPTDGPSVPSDLKDLGGRWLHEPSGIVLLRVEPGTYLMGSPPEEIDRDGDEAQNEVRVKEPFLLGETEVTVAQWRAVMGSDPPQEQENGDEPAKGITWWEAMKFVEKLDALGEGGWRLPTEVEWEYACRAGTTTAFAFGDRITPEQANFRGDLPYADTEKGLNRGDVVPVRSFPPNAWGFYDMHGNVWEWCSDLYLVHPGRTEPPLDPGASRSMRGGAYTSRGDQLRSAYRDGYPPRSTGPKYGFRVARSL